MSEETWTDENHTVWNRPTAWAYAQACKLIGRHNQRRANIEKVLEEVVKMDSILLMAGEMTTQERRTAKAVAKGIAAKIKDAMK